jgi:hypothetical protein
MAREMATRVARMWHDGRSDPVTGRRSNIEKHVLTSQEMMRAGDGNRTCMTSLEDSADVSGMVLDVGFFCLLNPRRSGWTKMVATHNRYMATLTHRVLPIHP